MLRVKQLRLDPSRNQSFAQELELAEVWVANAARVPAAVCLSEQVAVFAYSPTTYTENSLKTLVNAPILFSCHSD